MNNTYLKGFYALYFIIAIFFSMTSWPFWNIISDKIVFVFFLLGALFFALLYKPRRAPMKNRLLFSVLLLAIAFYTSTGNFFGYLSGICTILPIIMFFYLSREDQLVIYNVLYKSIVWVSGISLVAWLLCIIGLPSPWFPESFAGEYLFENHILFVVDIRKNLDLFSRFSCIFVEPGYYGCLLAIILYIEQFDFKKRSNLVLLAALFFTFSLGGWGIAAAGYAVKAISQQRVSKIVLAALTLSAIMAFGFLYKGGENILYERVLYRLEYNESTGTIKGDNRTNSAFNEWFADDFVKSQEALFGSQSIYEAAHTGVTGTETNVGWRAFIVHYGFFGVGLYFIFMFLLSRAYRGNLYTIGLLFLEILFFWQIEHQFKTAYLLIFYLAGVNILSSISSSSTVKRSVSYNSRTV